MNQKERAIGDDDVAALRRDYVYGELDEATAATEPFAQFERWFADVKASGYREPNAMALATVASDGRPSIRMVLFKRFDRDGFVFFTNYESRKGRELAAASDAALLFYWPELERQVRVEGTVEKVSAAESDAYFASRPRDAQIAAIASPQSERIADRVDLETRLERVRTSAGAGPVARPAHWGGYLLRPARFEFWQGRKNRTHDRLVYTADGATWKRERLAP